MMGQITVATSSLTVSLHHGSLPGCCSLFAGLRADRHAAHDPVAHHRPDVRSRRGVERDTHTHLGRRAASSAAAAPPPVQQNASQRSRTSPSSPPLRPRCASSMSQEPVARRELFSKVLGASALVAATAANAEVDYAGVGYLGGAKTIDVNNANVRVYQKLPGVYPNAAGKIVSKAPYKSKEDMYSKAGFSAPEAAAVKKYDSNFIFLEPRPEYIIDNINNGLYR